MTSATAVFLSVLLAFVNSSPVSKVDDYCEPSPGVILKHNEAWRDPNHCTIHRCQVGPSGAFTFALTCPTAVYPAHCRMVEGSGLYPDCCPKAECDENPATLRLEYKAISIA